MRHTYRLAVLTGWYWEKEYIKEGTEAYTHIKENNCHVENHNGDLIISRFCLPNGTAVQTWQTLPIKIDPPLKWILFWRWLK